MHTFAAFLTKLIDFFYEKFYFSRIFPREFFRYGVCGGSNMVLDWLLYFVIYHLLFNSFGSVVYLPFLATLPYAPVSAVTPHILAFCITFPITLLTGFWLNKYVTFTQSRLRGSKQLWRYVLIVAVNLMVNYLGLKFFVEYCQFYPTPSKMLVTLITVAISYFGQKYYSFKKEGR